MTSVARARLQDAHTLLSQGRHDGAAYLCGYAVEIALKARITKTLRWEGFPENNKEFAGLQSFRTHDLEMLLDLCGWKTKISANLPNAWRAINQWNPDSRYNPPGKITQAQASLLVKSASDVVGALL